MTDWQWLLMTILLMGVTAWAWTTRNHSGWRAEVKGALYGAGAAGFIFVTCCTAYMAGQGDVRRNAVVVREPISGSKPYFGKCIYEVPQIQICARDARD